MDLSWLQAEARTLHGIFESSFYAIVTVMLLLGVVVDYFQMPIGGTPGFVPLVGRAFVAAVLLHAYPEITNALADVTDALADKIGDLSKFGEVASIQATRLQELTWSWSSARSIIIVGISFITFYLLYISVYVAKAGIVYAWVLAYVFSPILIALYVLPATASATKTLFRSLFEVSAWKIVWATLATLLWSTAMVDLSKPADEVGTATLVCYNLMLAISLLMTPKVVSSLMNGGLASMAGTATAAVAGIIAMKPDMVTGTAKKALGGAKNFTLDKVSKGFGAVKRSFTSNVGRTPSSPKSATPTPPPPKWHSQVPFPKEPPPDIAARLARQKQQTKK